MSNSLGEFKKCSNCFQLKHNDKFYVKRANNKITRQSRCKACNNEVVQGYKLRKKQEFNDNYN